MTAALLDRLPATRAEAFAELRDKFSDDTEALTAIGAAESILAQAGQCATDGETFIGIPHLHNVSWGTARGCLVECSEKLHLKTLYDKCISLLAYGFNLLWCDCLNSRPNNLIPSKYKYWLLCHADISFRTKHWLDVMIEDLERSGADAIHVPMAIKDDRGLTSTGIGDAEKPWARVRRITVAELQKLPPVFGLDESVILLKKSGYVPKSPVFCPNTGVLLVKIGPWCWDFPGFNIEDRLTTECDQSGRLIRCAAVRPEDWRFGEWMQANGKKVLATRRVRTDHWREFCFSNDSVWGSPSDEGYLSDPWHR